VPSELGHTVVELPPTTDDISFYATFLR